MQPEALEFLDNIAQAVLNNAHELGGGYMAELFDQATVFCANFGMTEANVAEYLQGRLRPTLD